MRYNRLYSQVILGGGTEKVPPSFIKKGHKNGNRTKNRARNYTLFDRYGV